MRNNGLSLEDEGSQSLIADVCVLHSGFTEINNSMQLAQACIYNIKRK